MKKAAIFDMDGVIVDNMYYHQVAWKLFYEKYNFEYTNEKFKTMFGRTNQQILSHLFDKKLTLEETGLLGEEKEKIYRDIYRNHIKPITGLVEFVKILRENQIKTAVATSAPTVNVDFVLDILNLRHLFDAIVDASQVINSKPDPEIFLKAAAELNTPAKNCFVFEDSFSGIKAGINAGMSVVGVATTHKAEELEGTHFNIIDFNHNNLINKILN